MDQDICIICEKEVKYYAIINDNEICCQNCHDDLRLDWEELKQDR